jgi:A/G-specific adenine glycosylase
MLALQVSVRDPVGARELWALAAAWMPARDPSEWNQALMELGALVCTPRAPRCDACPVRARCRAYVLGRPEAFPPVPLRRATLRVRRAIVLIEDARSLLMVRRGGGLLDGLWEPPGTECLGRERARAALGRELDRLGIRARIEPASTTLRHRITHRDIEVEVWRGALVAPLTRGRNLRFIVPGAPRVALTALAQRASRLASGGARRRGRAATR